MYERLKKLFGYLGSRMALATSKGSFVWKRVEASCDSFGLTLLTRSVYAFSRERKQTKQGQDSKDEEKIEGRQKLKDERKRKASDGISEAK